MAKKNIPYDQKYYDPEIECASREDIEALHPEIKLGTVDTDDQAYLARQFGISSIPTLLFFKDGQVVARSTGYCGEAAIEELISR